MDRRALYSIENGISMNPKKDYQLLQELRSFHAEFINRISSTSLTVNDLLRMDRRFISQNKEFVEKISEFNDICIKYDVAEVVQVSLRYNYKRNPKMIDIFEDEPDHSIFSTIKIRKNYDGQLIDITITPYANKIMFPKHRTYILDGPYNFGDEEVSFSDKNGLTLSVKDIKREYNMESLPDDYWSWTSDDILLLKLSIDEN